MPVLTVAGIRGTGSHCALLESILRAAGYRVGNYYSPHLLRYNERVRVDGEEASDADLVAAFAAIEAARGDEQLTYFEFATLAAMWHFMRAGVDCAVLEVGLGGRLDAVNVWDADCAVVTYEFENVPVGPLSALGDVALRPNALALEVAQDRPNEKRLVNELGRRPAPLATAATHTDLHNAH